MHPLSHTGSLEASHKNFQKFCVARISLKPHCLIRDVKQFPGFASPDFLDTSCYRSVRERQPSPPIPAILPAQETSKCDETGLPGNPGELLSRLR
jgi:hypothetical protein